MRLLLLLVKREALTMAKTQRIAARSARLRFGFLLLAVILTSASIASAQYPLQYPSKSQVSKDGTTVLREDYANPPLSSMTHGGMAPGEINFKGQLGRVNSLRSEPSNAPLSSSRFFVNDLNGILYTLDKSTKKFTPYINFVEIFPRYTTEPGYAGGIVSI